MGGIACAGGDDGILAGNRGRREIGASCGGGFGVFGKGAAEIVQPLRVRAGVVVYVDDEFSLALASGVVAGGRKTGWGLGEKFGVESGFLAEGRDDVVGVVGGAVIDDEKFEVRVFDLFEKGKVVEESVTAIAGADGDGEEGVLAGRGVRFCELFGELLESRLGAAVAPSEAEGPIEDFAAPIEPQVAPRVDGESGGGLVAGTVVSPSEHFALLVFEFLTGESGRSFGPGVVAKFGEEEGAVASDVVEAAEVVSEFQGVF